MPAWEFSQVGYAGTELDVTVIVIFTTDPFCFIKICTEMGLKKVQVYFRCI